MNAVVTASAPGKLVLTGEYAVLAGATAVAAATNVRATVTVGPAESPNNELVVVNADKRMEFRGGFDSAPEWLDDPSGYSGITEAALAQIRCKELLRLPSATRIMIDTRDFYCAAAAPVKKGMGSSGAVVVALTGALHAWLGLGANLNTAMAIHRAFQEDKGSGIDVVTSWHGGMIAFTPGAESRVQVLTSTPEIQIRPVWTGVSASTPEMLAQLQKFRSAQPDIYQQMVDVLCISANQAAAAWRNANVSELLKAINDFVLSLQAFDEESGVGIWSEEHRELHALAKRRGVIYKPSGAGGGDYGLAFAVDAKRLEAFSRDAIDAGYGDAAPEWSGDGLKVSR